MSKSYNEIMNKIEIDDEMRKRVLRNIEKADIPEKPKINVIYRRIISMAACLALIIAGAFVYKNMSDSTITEPPSESETVQSMDKETASTEVTDEMVGTFGITECASAEELSEKLGFPVSDLKYLPFEGYKVEYSLYFGEFAQIDYINGSEIVSYRKIKGDEDISGDYNVYDDVKEITAGGVSVTVKGNGGIYYIAVWQKDGYSYSISDYSGLSEQAFADMAAGAE